MVRDYVFGLCELNLLNSCSDFLKYTDSEILNLVELSKESVPFPEYGNLNLVELAANIKNRRLPKRCFEISQNNINIPEGSNKTMDYFVKPFLFLKKDGTSKSFVELILSPDVGIELIFLSHAFETKF